MKGRHVKLATIPSMEEVDKERQRLEYRDRYVRVLKSTVYALVVVAAAAGCCWRPSSCRCCRCQATA